jgi:hypothetical protein
MGGVSRLGLLVVLVAAPASVAWAQQAPEAAADAGVLTGADAEAEAPAGAEAEAPAGAEAGAPAGAGAAPDAAPEPVPVPAADTGSEEVFFDPELAGVEAEPETSPLTSGQSGPTARVRFVLRSRFGIDTHVEDAYQDRYEATQLALLEAAIQQSDSLRFELGLRMTYITFAREADTPEAGSLFLELNVTPTAGFVDWSIVPSVHLRAGYQQVHLGRFDILGASDLLSVSDLRWGPTAMPEAVGVAQLGVRLDLQPTDWLSIGLYYLPFFQPHLAHLYGTDYSLAQIDAAAVQMAAEMNAGMPGDLNPLLRDKISRAAQSGGADAAFNAFAPDPDLSHGQAAMRVDARAGAAELGLTAGTALEKLPALYASQSLIDYVQALATDEGPSTADEVYLAQDPNPLDIKYNRYGLIALDAAHPLGPVLVGVELSYMFKRTLFAAVENEWAQPEQVDLMQAALRTEYVLGDTFLLGLEGFFVYAVDAPSDPARAWLTFAQGRYFGGGAGLIGWRIFESGFSIELGGGLFTGPSYLIAPRAEYEIIEGLSAEVGAYVIGGATPRVFGAPSLALGGLYDDVDQVFMGLRWVP